MSSNIVRQLTPYETRIYFALDQEIANQRHAQIATKRDKMQKGFTLMISGASSLVCLFLGFIPPLQHTGWSSLFLLLAPVAIIVTLITCMLSLSKKSCLGCLSLGIGSLVLTVIFFSVNKTIAGCILLFLFTLFLYPVYVGSKFVSTARKIRPLECSEIRKQTPPPTDEEFDAWLEERANTHLSALIRECNLDDTLSHSNQLLRVRGYILEGMEDSHSQALHTKQGEDGKWRYSMNTYTYFYPDEHQIRVFIFDINSMNWDDYRSTTKAYDYQDIVDVTSVDDYDTLYVDEETCHYCSQRFSLKLADGSTVFATVHSHPLDDEYLPTFDMPESGIDTAIAQLRMLLREKKGK